MEDDLGSGPGLIVAAITSYIPATAGVLGGVLAGWWISTHLALSPLGTALVVAVSALVLGPIIFLALLLITFLVAMALVKMSGGDVPDVRGPDA